MQTFKVRFAVPSITIAVAVASVTVLSAAAILWYSCERPKAVQLPNASEVESIEVTLWGNQIGLEDIQNRPLDRSHFSSVLRCLSPAQRSEVARQMLALPPLGELLIRTNDRGERRVVFVDTGKNPLCFSVDGVPCLRGGPRYQGYRADHKELYGVDFSAIDEAWCLTYKLAEMCGLRQPSLHPGQ